MIKNRITWVLTILLVSVCLAQGQNQKILSDADYASYPHWMKMMQDPNGNFFETQKAFKLYWQDREIPEKGSGYNLFKRWEYQWESRINPDGSYPEPDHEYKEFNNYVKTHQLDATLKTESETWRELGPKSRTDKGSGWGMGRISAIAFHPTDTATIYVGAPTGGFWITHDGGNSWTTSTDNQPVLGVSAILVDPINPEIILIGTGDRDHGFSPGGMGVFRSDDGGLTWTTFNKGMGNVTVGMFARQEDDPKIILAAANGGIFKTIDEGENWVKTSPRPSNYTDIKFKPGGGSIAYACSPQGFYRSENAGETWSLVPASSGYINGDRMVIGVTPANDSLVYLISGQSYPEKFLGCFLSRDFGRSFTIQSSSPNILQRQISYNLCIQVDPINPLILYVGGIWVWKSIDGGINWQDAAISGPFHVDQHILAVNKLNNRLYAGHDGGIYYTDNGGTNWIDISSGLGIGQIYKIGVSANESDILLAGFQDNGTAWWNGHEWTTIGGGDGIECEVDRTDSKYYYLSSQNGPIYQSFNKGAAQLIAGPSFKGINDVGGWITPFLLSEADGNTMVIGYQNVWISKNIRSQENIKWRKISDNLANNNSQFVVLEQSPADGNILYAARQNGQILRTDNLLDTVVTWTPLNAAFPISRPNYYIDIESHPYDVNTVYLVNNNKVYKSGNQGLAFEDITESLPDIPLGAIVYDKSSDEGIYVGSNAGVYYKDGDMPDWILYGKSMPVSVKVTELEIYYDSVSRQGSRLRASTYGRGLWEIGLAETNPAPPKQLLATALGETVELKWNPPFYKQDVQSYRIYRNNIPIAAINDLSFTDLAIEKDVTYFYKVTALYQGEGESGFSNEVFVTIISPVVLPYNQQFEKGTGGWTAKFYIDGWNYGTSEQLGISGGKNHFFGVSSMAVTDGTHVKDYLSTPVIDLSLYQGMTVSLNFDYTMRQYYNYDKFSVLYRQAPDSAWIILKNLEPPASTEWVWDTAELNLPEEALSSHTQIGFLYDNSGKIAMGAAVDDVKIFVNTTSANIAKDQTSVRIFPNPTNGILTLELHVTKPDEVNMRVFNIQGQIVLEKIFKCNYGTTVETIDLSGQLNGIYMLNLLPEKKDWQLNQTIILDPANNKNK